MQIAAMDTDACFSRRTGEILVVDDDPGFRDIITYALERAGYSVRESEDGLQALDMLTAQRPDLVILDVMMPGLDGYEVLRRMEVDPSIRAPVLVVSAAPSVDLTRWPVAAVLAKPFGSSQLIWLVEKILEDGSSVHSASERRAAP